MNRYALPVALLILATVHAKAQNPLAIPPALDMDTFDLTIDESSHEFYPGVVTQTYGINSPYLGPTLILHKGDTAHFRVHNQLSEIAGMHWNGMEVPPEFDGSPPRVLQPGDTWNVKYKVIDKASVYVYHPHTMDLIGAQVNKGAAGLIIVRDDEEAALALPRTYGVDDFPIAVQDKKFSLSGQFLLYPYGDSILVNGTPHPYLDCPAQMVRLRLVNASLSRYYPFGFEGDIPFQVIASEGGLLAAPATMTRIMLSSGERAEILVNLSDLEGDSLLLKSFGSELPSTIPGSNNILWESSSLNGIDFPILRIRVGPPTPDPITTIPTTLGDVQPYLEASAARTRIKEIAGYGMVGSMPMFTLNGQGWNMNAINDTIQFGDTEIWSYINHSTMAHPMTMHGGSFFVLDRNGQPPAEWERGPKSVVHVGVGDTVRVIMRFDKYTTDGWPLMYHCHNLMHINHMMWQFIIVDPTLSTPTVTTMEQPLVYPVPSSSLVHFNIAFPVMQLRVLDLSGREVLRMAGPRSSEGAIDIGALSPGNYIAVFMGLGQQTQTRIVRE